MKMADIFRSTSWLACAFSLVVSPPAIAASASNSCGQGYIKAIRVNDYVISDAEFLPTIWITLDATGFKPSTRPKADYIEDDGQLWIGIESIKNTTVEFTNMQAALRGAMLARQPVQLVTFSSTSDCKGPVNDFYAQICNTTELCNIVN